MQPWTWGDGGVVIKGGSPMVTTPHSGVRVGDGGAHAWGCIQMMGELTPGGAYR